METQYIDFGYSERLRSVRVSVKIIIVLLLGIQMEAYSSSHRMIIKSHLKGLVELYLPNHSVA